MSSPNKTLSYVIKYAGIQAQGMHKAAAGIREEILRNAGMLRYGLRQILEDKFSGGGARQLSEFERRSIKRLAAYPAVREAVNIAASNPAHKWWMIPIKRLSYLWQVHPTYVLYPSIAQVFDIMHTPVGYGLTAGVAGGSLNLLSEALSKKKDKDYLGQGLTGFSGGTLAGIPLGLALYAAKMI